MEERIRKALGNPEVAIKAPPSPDMGDYAVFAGKDADAYAEMLRAEFGADAAAVAVVNGFVNITLSASTVSRGIDEVLQKKGGYGRDTSESGKRIVVEYSCPNPMKEMHLGHLMSTVIGEAVSRVAASSGATVIRDSYGGDVGPHVAKTLWALRHKGVTDVASASEVDDAYVHGARAYEESEEAKAEIEALNQEIYRMDNHELVTLWQKCREVCLEAFRDIYAVLDTHFDYFFFESETAPIGMEVVKDGLAKGVFEESEGAIIYKGENKGLHTLVFVTSRGTPTYETKDIGLAFLKEERIPNDSSIILTGSEQVGHFAVFLAALEDIAPLVAKKTAHVTHGHLKLTTGKMSSREGTTITAQSLIDDVIEKAKEKNEDPVVARQVAVAALKYMILRQAPGGDIIFDPEKSLALDGDSGPYLQYALVRARKILAYDAQGNGDSVPSTPYVIERMVLKYPAVVARARAERAPHYIAQYLTQLAAEWNAFYAKEQILGSPEESYKQKVARAFALTMESGLALLGIPAPERM